MSSSTSTAEPAVESDLSFLAGFEPSAARAQALDRRMRQRLAASLRYIVEQAAGHIEVPPGDLEAFLDRLTAGPVSPQAFGAYCDLILAIDDDAIDEAQKRMEEILATPSAASNLAIAPLADPKTDAASDRYVRLADTDATAPLVIRPPSAADADTCRARIEETMDLFDRTHPELAGEIRALLREIVLAVGPGDADAFEFAGASIFMMWGGLVLNAECNETRLEMVQALAHESGHSMLFGLSAGDGALVDDDDRERFSSPLRADPRPMDGIYHATYVIARMHHATRHLLDAGALASAEEPHARKDLENFERIYADGRETLDRANRLTPLGRIVIADADAYMSSQS